MVLLNDTPEEVHARFLASIDALNATLERTFREYEEYKRARARRRQERAQARLRVELQRITSEYAMDRLMQPAPPKRARLRLVPKGS